MSECKPCSTPVDTHAKVPADIGPPVSDPTHYKSLAGALHYLTFTRPDISYASSRSVYICMIRESPTCLLSSESYSIFVALSIMVFFFIVAPLQSWLYILMLIGPLLPLTSTSGHSTNSIGWSRKTYKPRIYNTWCAQAPIALRYANLA